jgi:hypothetical protein
MEATTRIELVYTVLQTGGTVYKERMAKILNDFSNLYMIETRLYRLKRLKRKRPYTESYTKYG